MAHRAQLVIAPYSPHWPRDYEAERALLEASLPSGAIFLEHIGSTAVPGLAAKPIIDMMLGVSSLIEIDGWISRIESLGYEYMPAHEKVMPERRFFAKPHSQPRRFHLHAVVLGGAFWREHLAFRDALRDNSRLAAEYELLKQRLAADYGDDREGYGEGKAPFIASVVKRASESRRPRSPT